jgi:hypothetical protein
MSLDLFKEIIPSLLKINEHLINNEIEESDYTPFIVNKALAQHIDCIFYVNEMNINCHLDKKMQYDYLFHSLRRYNRGYQKWYKNTESSDLQLIKEYYNYSTDKAKQVLPLFSKEDLIFIKNKLDKGGKS